MTRSLKSQIQSPAASEVSPDCSKEKEAPDSQRYVDLPGGAEWGLGQNGPRSTVPQLSDEPLPGHEPLLDDGAAGLVN